MVKETNDNPQPPKRPLSAFFLFRQNRYKEVSEANPKISVAEITKIISNEWNKLSDVCKQEYKKQYDTSKAKYDDELKDFVNKYGKVEKKKKIKRGNKDKSAKNAKKAEVTKNDAEPKDSVNKK